ncbi:MAG: molybdopterin molybdotransferase MoeA [Planctomycetota bacterium]|nr:molybdopterin molybdotransferase MoeA [Planctomycetota bacterium]
MIPLEEALRIVLERCPRLPTDEVSLYQAPGAVLAEEIRSDRDYPPFTRSAMDGFAVRASDTKNPPRTLSVVEEIRAGRTPERSVGAGEASSIMTGAPLPEGADAVIPVEQTEPQGDRSVVLQAQAEPGQHICLQGEDMSEGAVAIEMGTRIRPEEIAVLAALGHDRPKIYRKPSVAILSTGDELVDAGAEPAAGQIRNSNGYALWAQSRSMGVPAHLLGIAPDRPEAIEEKIREALQDDLVLISGGVSMGEYDLVGQALSSLGLEPGFERVAIKPGKPTIFGTIGGKPVFGLPGNPVSGFVIFHILVRPAIEKMMGVGRPAWDEREAVLEEGNLKPTRRWQFLPAFLRREGKGYLVRRVPWKGSGDIFGPSRGNCLLQVPIDSPPLGPGDAVRVIPLQESL